ncbi:MAG: phytanoyl-CoA dioxygenase family protein [Burkholderiales bacterium]
MTKPAPSSAIEAVQRAQYDSQGLLVLPGVLSRSAELRAVVDEIEELGRTFRADFALSDSAALAMFTDKARGNFYRALRYLPSLAALGGCEYFRGLCQSLGLRFPALMRSYNIRMDTPGADEHLFHWHQDVTYLLGSLNSVTLWLPLGPADTEHGSVAYIPSSHNALRPFEFTSAEAREKTAQHSPRDIRLCSEPQEEPRIVTAGAGDLVVFSQFLVHRSTPNRSARCRWTVQLRYSDLCEPQFRDAGFPFGDMTTVARTDYLTCTQPIRSSAIHDQF